MQGDNYIKIDKFILHHLLLPRNHGTDVQLWERQILLHCIHSKEEEVCLTCQHTPTPNEQIVCMLQIAKICKGKRSSHKTLCKQ